MNTFPAILRAAAITVHLHQEHFPQDEADAAWMPEVARQGWIILSPDIQISRARLEVDAIMTSGASVFCLSGDTARARKRRATFCAACRRS